jgi:hypothetical protein
MILQYLIFRRSPLTYRALTKAIKVLRIRPSFEKTIFIELPHEGGFPIINLCPTLVIFRIIKIFVKKLLKKCGLKMQSKEIDSHCFIES